MKQFLLFVGSRCPACVTMKANLAKVGIEYEGISIDTINGAKLALKYCVKTLPTLVVLQDGRTDSYPGSYPMSELEKIK